MVKLPTTGRLGRLAKNIESETGIIKKELK